MQADLSPILAVPFVHPALAAAGAGMVSLPIVIHLLNRRRFRRVIWAAMEWLLAAHRKNARRIRIEQLILLLIRCLIMLLIGFAIARPFLGALGLGRLFGESRTLRVLVLDNSYSMNYGAEADAPLARGKTAALELIDMFDRDDAVAIVLAQSPARALIAEPTSDRTALKQAIEQLRPSARGTDLAGAMQLAREILKRPDAPRGRQVILIGDRTRSAWPTAESKDNPLADEFKLIGEQAELAMIDVSPKESSNLAITDFSARYEIVGVRHEVYVSVQVTNYAEKPRGDLELLLTMDGDRGSANAFQDKATVATADKPIGAGEAVTVEKLVQFPRGEFHTIAARLVDAGKDKLTDDALAEDNQRFFSMQVLESVDALLVDGDPGRKLSESETFYLWLSLTPITKTGIDAAEELGRFTLHPKREPADTLQATPGWLDEIKLVVLANVNANALDEKTAAELVAFCRRGGGLMIFPGSRASAEASRNAYNRIFFADGAGPLPGRILGVAGDERDRQGGKHFDLDSARFDHPVLAEFDREKEVGHELIRGLRTFRHTTVDLPAKTQAEVLLRYEDGTPAILAKRFGEGRCIYVTTTADMAWNNFGGRKAYLPLLNAMAYHLAPAGDVRSRNLAIGGAFAERLTAEQANALAQLVPPMSAKGHDARSMQLVPDRIAGAAPDARHQFIVRSSEADQAGGADLMRLSGFYHLSAGKVVFPYAVNPPADAEADVRPVAVPVLESVLGSKQIIRGEEVAEARQELIGGTEISRSLLYLVLALCLVETFLAMRFGHFRE